MISGSKYSIWQPRSSVTPRAMAELPDIILRSRNFRPIDKLDYGDHGLIAAQDAIKKAIQSGQRIALYADYDVDGTMSCVSWIWFFRAIGFENFIHYIPCRFKEGYGLNLDAMKYLIDEQKAELIITMDTGITANAEAEYCKQRGVTFICTDHHKIQPDKMPDCIILNPKQHPNSEYQELCGCGITFVLLRRLGQDLTVAPDVWTDLLALCGMATICDMVTLNGVNHRLARMGLQALVKSQNPVLMALKKACAVDDDLNEIDVGFRLGPRINAVGRMEHADLIIKAFVDYECEPLIHQMGHLNEQRKTVQKAIVDEAIAAADSQEGEPILFLGGDWHPGVVGIAASRLVEKFWRPTWLFQIKDGVCKGSARAIPGFDVTEAMQSVGHLMTKFGGHSAAGGFSFLEENLEQIYLGLSEYALDVFSTREDLWESKIKFDCRLPAEFLTLDLANMIDQMRPFGLGFDEPRFVLRGKIEKFDYYRDKQTQEKRHTAIFIKGMSGLQKVMFFNEVVEGLEAGRTMEALVSVTSNQFQGTTSLSLIGSDLKVYH